MAEVKLVGLSLLWLWSWWSLEGVEGDPQLFLLKWDCSGFIAPNLSNFNKNLNATFADLRDQLSNQRNHFASAQATTGSDPVYAMFQCRNYLSDTDCATCFTAAVTQIRNCSAGVNGARVVYDGCFLRYESNDFFDQIFSRSSILCGNQTADGSTDFGAVGAQVLIDLRIGTPKIRGYFAATKTKVAGGAIYAFAQCAETLSQDTCLDCLSIEESSVRGCLPSTEGRAFDPGCFMRYSETPFFADNQTIDITPFLKQGGRGPSKKWILLGGCVGGALLVVILISLFPWHKRSQSPKRVPTSNVLGASELKGATKFKYSELKAATRNFSEKNILGEGGFGAVYKGTMKNGKVVAVKKLFSGNSSEIDENFESEVTLVSNVHHRNLVRLLGCCSKGREKILVYEYMANNSLDKFLFGNRKGSLNWKQRYEIILGTARGLAYLHEEFYVSIIHRDIKSGNVLLDEQLQPKISDFGLVKLLPGDQSHLRTKVAGTLGYTAPEYVLHGQLSKKADTYSYGIVVLEIISGQRCTDVKSVDGSHEYLLRRAWDLYEKGMELELVDKSLGPNSYDIEEVKKVIGIALLCTQPSAGMRPAISEVVVLLSSNDFLERMRPSMPIFIESNGRAPRDISASTASSVSNASASHSIVPAR